MGQWTLLSLKESIRPRNDVYGHYFAVCFKLKYTPSTMGSFTEMPRLEWKETITMIEKNKNTWWQYIGDQYARNPNSQTFNTWVNRYNAAHFAVRHGKYGEDDIVRLYDKTGARLNKDDLARMSNTKEQADEVRNYLKKNGGIMEIIVVDKPGINKSNDAKIHKNRILTFDCGLQGHGMRIAAYQHLTVDGSKPEPQWHRKCEKNAITSPFQTSGLRKVLAPADVSITKPFTGGAQRGTYQ